MAEQELDVGIYYQETRHGRRRLVMPDGETQVRRRSKRFNFVKKFRGQNVHVESLTDGTKITVQRDNRILQVEWPSGAVYDYTPWYRYIKKTSDGGVAFTLRNHEYVAASKCRAAK